MTGEPELGSERPMPRTIFTLGALFAALGVTFGAFGAHGLKTRLEPEMLAIFETGVRYQMYHAFGMLAAAWLYTQAPSTAVKAAGWLFAVGILIFSGTLYGLSLSSLGQAEPLKWLGMITPLGGLAMIVGWICLAVGAWKLKPQESPS